jgi:signal transduction histidine kinase
MWEALDRLFSGQFMPHGHCYLWTPSMVWLQVGSNLLIALAYLSISLTLAYIVLKIKDIPFSWMYVAFGVFIITCGGTHAIDIVTIWDPIYWFDGGLRVVTAIASVAAAVLLLPLVPKAIALADATQLAHARGLKLEATYEELARAHEETRSIERQKTEFFANISHELRTPLALILGPLENVSRSANLTPAQVRDLEVVTRNARTLLRHVNELLDVAKLEAGKMNVTYARGDLAALVRAAASSFEVLARDRHLTLEVVAPGELPADIDAEKLERVLVNVIANAFKFTPEGGRVSCTVVEERGRAHISVADSGPGVPEHLRATIFERFAQAAKGTAGASGGTGLGLAIAKDLVELHGGTISVTDVEDGPSGARFVIDLPLEHATVQGETFASPLSASALPPQDVHTVRAPLGGALPGDLDAPLVLVVEDNRDMNAFLAESLASHYRIERAFDGVEGLRLANDRRPDIVVTDVTMPEMGGDALFRELRGNPLLADIPVVILTASGNSDLRVELLREGASDFLQKPLRIDELRARIGNLLMMKRARDVLRRALASRADEVDVMALDLAEQKRQLEGALDAVRVARDHSERASRLKTAFLGMISHELRTPLTTMQLLVDRLATGALEEPKKKLVERLGRSTARLAEMIDSLLRYTALQSGQLEKKVAQVDLAALVTSTADELHPVAKGKGLSLTVQARDATLESDPTLLRLVLRNLLSNAVKFTDQGFVEICIEPAQPSTAGFIVRVRDSGRGIDRAQLAAIFEPFHHLEPVRQKHVPGIGLGLSLVREIVASLGGAIAVESELAKGSTFSITLPLSSST